MIQELLGIVDSAISSQKLGDPGSSWRKHRNASNAFARSQSWERHLPRPDSEDCTHHECANRTRTPCPRHMTASKCNQPTRDFNGQHQSDTTSSLTRTQLFYMRSTDRLSTQSATDIAHREPLLDCKWNLEQRRRQNRTFQEACHPRHLTVLQGKPFATVHAPSHSTELTYSPERKTRKQCPAQLRLRGRSTDSRLYSFLHMPNLAEATTTKISWAPCRGRGAVASLVARRPHVHLSRRHRPQHQPEVGLRTRATE